MEEERWWKVSMVNGWEKKKKEEEEEDETKVERSLNNSWRRNKRDWRNRQLEKGRNIIKLPWRRYSWWKWVVEDERRTGLKVETYARDGK